MAPATRLRRERRIAIVAAFAALMKGAEPTPFALEASCRYGLRVALIFDGWTWGAADAEAALVVNAALHSAGAKRPTWQQGQPEYCQDGHAPRTRERCARCAKPLPDGNYRYCSRVCATAAKVDRNRERDQEARYAAEKIYRAAWTSRQPPRECPQCNKSFKPKRTSSVYCSNACKDDALRSRALARRRTVSLVCDAV